MRPDRLDTARVFERVFAIYRLQAGVLLPAAVVVYLVPAIAAAAGSIWLLLASLIIATAYYQAVVVQAVRDIQDGVRDLSLGRLLRSVSPVFAPVLWTALLVGFCIGAGVVLFLVPGLIVLTFWSVSVPVVVCEVRTPREAISRSMHLVRGHGWRVFSVLIVTLLVLFLASEALAVVANAVSEGPVASAIASLLGNAITAPVFSIATAVLYLELLQLKGEQLPPADMAGLSDGS